MPNLDLDLDLNLKIDLPNPRGHSPLRRPVSIRRTSSIDVTWPGARDDTLKIHGIARDIFTPADSGLTQTSIIAMDEVFADITKGRTIGNIRVIPNRDNISNLIGIKCTGYLRQSLDGALPNERKSGLPLYLLLDDIPGCILISQWAWTAWPKSQAEEDKADRKSKLAKMENVCIGFRPGSGALITDGTYQRHRAALVSSLYHPKDPEGWHTLTSHDNISMRRARRMDVWIDGDIYIDATFQDSASTEENGRIAVHEYSLAVSVDSNTMAIKNIVATPHVLPFPECPSAINHVHQMIGTPLAELRTTVLTTLRKTKGCTHLNDAIRALTDVPVMVAQLQERS